MSVSAEFHYRIPRRLGAWRPGSHPATSLGAGQEFVSHLSLYDRPDPRRLDLRASLRDVRGDWLVRVNRQRAAVAVQVIVDVSASMTFGSRKPKLHVVADFVESLGQSAFRTGDALGMSAFDEVERMDLFVPALMSRGAGGVMSELLRSCSATARGAAGLAATVGRLAGRPGLVFLVSDFHWPLQQLDMALEGLARAFVVPMVVWDDAEVEAPRRNGLMSLRDVESGSQRTLWLRPALRARWAEGVARRRAELDSLFARHALRPFYVLGEFDGEQMSRYFFEAAA
ncbi:MAG: MxaS protein [Gammaproteobacteria bacterium]